MPNATWSTIRPAQRFALPGTALDSWINVAQRARRIDRQRAANSAGAEVNPPIPNTASGSNSSHSRAQSRVAPAKREQKRINWRDPA
jgi:hypothetical protein